MPDLLDHEPAIRLSGFLGVLLVMGLWEVAAPRRRCVFPRLLRWSNNLALAILNTALVRLALPVVAVGFALFAAERGWGCSTSWSFQSGSLS